MILIVAVDAILLSARFNLSVNDSIRWGQKSQLTTEQELRADNERRRFQLGLAALQTNTVSLLSSTLSQSILLCRFGRCHDDDDYECQWRIIGRQGNGTWRDVWTTSNWCESTIQRHRSAVRGWCRQVLDNQSFWIYNSCAKKYCPADLQRYQKNTKDGPILRHSKKGAEKNSRWRASTDCIAWLNHL